RPRLRTRGARGAARARMGQPESGAAALLHSQGAGHQRGAAERGAPARVGRALSRISRLFLQIVALASNHRVLWGYSAGPGKSGLKPALGLNIAAQHLRACVTISR